MQWKIYYELLDAREKRQRRDIALVRLEQFYPFPEAELAAILKTYPDGATVAWVQEEPENMGAWPFLRFRYGHKLLGKWTLQGTARSIGQPGHWLRQRTPIGAARVDPPGNGLLDPYYDEPNR